MRRRVQGSGVREQVTARQGIVAIWLKPEKIKNRAGIADLKKKPPAGVSRQEAKNDFTNPSKESFHDPRRRTNNAGTERANKASETGSGTTEIRMLS
jgi:hypothetical protein